MHNLRKMVNNVNKTLTKEAIAKKGFSTQKELAEYFHCSLHTIQRRMNSKEIMEYFNKNHS